MVMVDAGSSGSRVHVFKLTWPRQRAAGGESREEREKGDGRDARSQTLPEIELPSKKLKVEPGLSSYEKNPGAAGDSLVKLIEFARRHVPSEKWYN